MVRIAVRTITLNVYKGKVPYELMPHGVSNLTASAGFPESVQTILWW